jgi:hypothetical protein
MTASTANLMDHLQEQGYEPQGATTEGDYYDLVVSGTGTVRVVVCPGDPLTRADVYAFEQYMCCEWRASFTPGTPDAVIIATVEAAEWQLAAKRGGPVTPAQEEAAR